jgi:hypothetical protein
VQTNDLKSLAYSVDRMKVEGADMGEEEEG